MVREHLQALLDQFEAQGQRREQQAGPPASDRPAGRSQGQGGPTMDATGPESGTGPPGATTQRAQQGGSGRGTGPHQGGSSYGPHLGGSSSGASGHLSLLPPPLGTLLHAPLHLSALGLPLQPCLEAALRRLLLHQLAVAPADQLAAGLADLCYSLSAAAAAAGPAIADVAGRGMRGGGGRPGVAVAGKALAGEAVASGSSGQREAACVHERQQRLAQWSLQMGMLAIRQHVATRTCPATTSIRLLHALASSPTPGAARGGARKVDPAAKRVLDATALAAVDSTPAGGIIQLSWALARLRPPPPPPLLAAIEARMVAEVCAGAWACATWVPVFVSCVRIRSAHPLPTASKHLHYLVGVAGAQGLACLSAPLRVELLHSVVGLGLLPEPGWLQAWCEASPAGDCGRLPSVKLVQALWALGVIREQCRFRSGSAQDTGPGSRLQASEDRVQATGSRLQDSITPPHAGASPPPPAWPGHVVVPWVQLALIPQLQPQLAHLDPDTVSIVMSSLASLEVTPEPAFSSACATAMRHGLSKGAGSPHVSVLYLSACSRLNVALPAVLEAELLASLQLHLPRLSLDDLAMLMARHLPPHDPAPPGGHLVRPLLPPGPWLAELQDACVRSKHLMSQRQLELVVVGLCRVAVAAVAAGGPACEAGLQGEGPAALAVAVGGREDEVGTEGQEEEVGDEVRAAAGKVVGARRSKEGGGLVAVTGVSWHLVSELLARTASAAVAGRGLVAGRELGGLADSSSGSSGSLGGSSGDLDGSSSGPGGSSSSLGESDCHAGTTEGRSSGPGGSSSWWLDPQQGQVWVQDCRQGQGQHPGPATALPLQPGPAEVLQALPLAGPRHAHTLHPDLVRHIQGSRGHHGLGRLNPAALLKLLHSMASLSLVPTPAWLHAWCRACPPGALEGVPGGKLVQVLWALSILRDQSPPLNVTPCGSPPAAWSEHVAPSVWSEHVAPSVWSEHVAPSEWSEHVVPSVWSEHVVPWVRLSLIPHLKPQLPCLGPDDMSTVLSSLAGLGVTPDPSFSSVCFEAVQRGLDTGVGGSPPACVALLSACSCLNVALPAGLEAELLASLQPHLPRLSLDDLTLLAAWHHHGPGCAPSSSSPAECSGLGEEARWGHRCSWRQAFAEESCRRAAVMTAAQLELTLASLATLYLHTPGSGSGSGSIHARLDPDLSLVPPDHDEPTVALLRPPLQPPREGLSVLPLVTELLSRYEDAAAAAAALCHQAVAAGGSRAPAPATAPRGVLAAALRWILPWIQSRIQGHGAGSGSVPPTWQALRPHTLAALLWRLQHTHAEEISAAVAAAPGGTWGPWLRALQAVCVKQMPRLSTPQLEAVVGGLLVLREVAAEAGGEGGGAGGPPPLRWELVSELLTRQWAYVATARQRPGPPSHTVDSTSGHTLGSTPTAATTTISGLPAAPPAAILTRGRGQGGGGPATAAASLVSSVACRAVSACHAPRPTLPAMTALLELQALQPGGAEQLRVLQPGGAEQRPPLLQEQQQRIRQQLRQVRHLSKAGSAFCPQGEEEPALPGSMMGAGPGSNVPWPGITDAWGGSGAGKLQHSSNRHVRDRDVAKEQAAVASRQDASPGGSGGASKREAGPDTLSTYSEADEVACCVRLLYLNACTALQQQKQQEQHMAPPPLNRQQQQQHAGPVGMAGGALPATWLRDLDARLTCLLLPRAGGGGSATAVALQPQQEVTLLWSAALTWRELVAARGSPGFGAGGRQGSGEYPGQPATASASGSATASSTPGAAPPASGRPSLPAPGAAPPATGDSSPTPGAAPPATGRPSSPVPSAAPPASAPATWLSRLVQDSAACMVRLSTRQLGCYAWSLGVLVGTPLLQVGSEGELNKGGGGELIREGGGAD